MKVLVLGKSVIFTRNKKSEVAASAFHWWFSNYQDVLEERYDGHFEFVVSKHLYTIKCPNAEIAKKVYQDNKKATN